MTSGRDRIAAPPQNPCPSGLSGRPGRRCTASLPPTPVHTRCRDDITFPVEEVVAGAKRHNVPGSEHWSSVADGKANLSQTIEMDLAGEAMLG